MYVSSSKKRGQAKDCGLSIRLRGVSVIIFDLSDTSLKKLNLSQRREVRKELRLVY
jgi:hypothetical protein